MIAVIRPSAWELPLFLHVLGAVVLFGGVAALVVVSFAGLRVAEHAPMLRRLAFVTTLVLVWPAYVVMRLGAQWVLSREGLDGSPPGWVGYGFAVSDGGIIVLLLLTLFGWLAVRRRPRVAPVFAWLSALYLVALGVAWWAMSVKPG
jgi:hypothetical protein